MRILFAANSGIAVPVLEELFRLAQTSSDYELPAILTYPDSPQGRSSRPLPTEIAEAAERLSAEYAVSGKPAPPIIKPAQLDSGARELIAAFKPELLVCFAYGSIFGPKFLSLFPMGGINIHPSLLPRFRGAAPIPAVILAGEKETGISIQRLAEEMDTGDILVQERVALNGHETAAGLSRLMAKKAAELLPGTLAGIASGTLRGRPQNHPEASYCSLIAKEDGVIDWNKSAAEIYARIRAFDPWPLSWTMHGNQQLFILRAGNGEAVDACITPACPASGAPPGRVLGIDKEQGILVQTGEGVLAVSELQYRSKKPLHWKDFLNGARNFIGSRLG